MSSALGDTGDAAPTAEAVENGDEEADRRRAEEEFERVLQIQEERMQSLRASLEARRDCKSAQSESQYSTTPLYKFNDRLLEKTGTEVTGGTSSRSRLTVNLLRILFVGTTLLLFTLLIFMLPWKQPPAKTPAAQKPATQKPKGGGHSNTTAGARQG